MPPRGAVRGPRIDAERLEFLGPVADADAEEEAPARDDVDGRPVLGDAQRVVERKEQKGLADSHPRCLGGDGGRHGERGGAVAVGREVVLGQPHVVVAELLGEANRGQRLAVDVGVRPPPLGRVAEVDHDPEAHGSRRPRDVTEVHVA